MKYEADWTQEGVEYSIDVDYVVENYFRPRTHTEPEESGSEIHVEKIRKCVIKDSGKTYIIFKADTIPDKYFDVIRMNIEKDLW